jgi:uncharacterized protein
MANLYVASTESFVGKSAVCAGLLDHLRRDGFSVGYMKPVSVSVTHTPDAVLDEDAAFIRESFGLAAPLEQIAPVLLRRATIEAVLKGERHDWAAQVQSAYAAISQAADVTVLEGTNSWTEGALVDLSADRVADMLDAPMLLVTRYRTTLAVDAILSVQRFAGDRLRGVLLNQIEETRLDFVQSHVVPFLEDRGISVFGLVPQEVSLAGIPVEELIEELGGQLVGAGRGEGKVIESLMIGAMGAEASLSHFRRRTNKAVITGGDRTDLQIAALETSTVALVLSGNIRPAQVVVDRAEARNVPIVLVSDDTLTTVERVENLFGHVRFHQKAKLERFTRLLDEHLDWARLYAAIGLKK